MDNSKSSHKRHDGNLTKTTVISPVKGHGKATLGFHGFKITNSNIRLVKQVDVRTPILKPITTPETTSIGASQPSISSQEKQTRAESLKKLREKIQFKRKLYEEIKEGCPNRETVDALSNRVHGEHVAVSPIKFPTVESSKPKTPDKTEITKVTLPDVNSETRSAEVEHVISDSAAQSRELRSPVKDKKDDSKRKHSLEKSDKKAKSETSSSSRGCEFKHEPNYRKNKERSKSPHRVREYRSSKAYNSSNDRSRSPYHSRDSYSSSKGSSSLRRPSHRSRKREATYARKYSASHKSSNSTSNSDSRSHQGHRNDKGKACVDDGNYHRRSSSHRRSSPERNTSSKQKSDCRTSTESRDDISSKDNSRSSHSRSSDEHAKQAEQKTTRFVENKKHSRTDELLSKLSFALVNEDEEEFEQGVESSPQKETGNDVEAADTDLESFSAPNDTENSEVDTACEDELSQDKIIDQRDTDTVDSFSTAPDDNTDLEDSESSIQDMKFNVVKSEAARMDLCHEASFLELYEKMNSECSADTSSVEGDELNKIDELRHEPMSTSAASFEINSDIVCDILVPQNSAAVNEPQQEGHTSQNIPETSKAESFKNENRASSMEMRSEKNNLSSSVETPSPLVLDTKHIKNEHIQTVTGNLSNSEYLSSQSDKSPVRLTPYSKDGPRPPSPVLQNKSPNPLPKPAAEHVSAPENRIPTITSQLKDVFKSLLRTDFQTDQEENVPKLNGVIFLNKTNLTNCDEVREDKQSTQGVDTAADKVAEPPTIQSDSLEYKITDVQRDTGGSQTDTACEIQNDESDCTDVFRSCHTSTHNTGSVITVSKFSPDQGSKPSSYKLKLHATTRTPLPAKKSYIQQVQSSPNSSKVNYPEAGMFSLATKLFVQSDGGVSSGVESPEVKPMVNFTDLDQSRKEIIVKSDSHCEEGITGSRDEDNSELLLLSSGLSRQESSESSTNDNEEGLRRSARIRTKKTEKTLKKQLSIETAPNQNPPVVNIASDNTREVESAINFQHEMIERLSKDLSGEELFKARIHVAPDVDDCPDPFELLDENLYLMSMKKSRARKEIRRMVCDCALEETLDFDGPCGENCLNRLLMIECSSRCHYGNRCTNKRFQHRIYAPTEVFKTSFKGWGIRAATDIEPGQLVMEYCGEVMDQREFTRRSLEYSKSKHAHFYFMALSQDEVIDATCKGNSSRFINHSCDPNAETQKWTVNGRLRVGFFTLRRIEKREEITFDYQFERYGKVAQKCFCGTAKCRGYLGKAPDKDEDDTKLSKLLSNEALSPYDDASNNDSQEKDSRKKKKLAYFADNTMEKDISKLLGGLRSSKEVLALSRLMVRCDTHAQRIMCLQVLNETTSQTRLKTFLQFHGLSIVWSWMVDIGTVEDTDSLSLKLEIINTLCNLPITNKNVIEDSKVLSVVQRWAKPETEEKATSQEERSPKEDEAEKKENNVGAVQSEVDGDKEKVEPVTQEPKVSIIPTDDDGEAANQPTSDDTTDHPTENNEVKRNEKVLSAAASLLDSWKDLKEIYIIPKRQKPLPSPNQDSSSRDNSVSRNSSPSSKQNRTDDYEHRAMRHSRSRRESSQERLRDSFDRSLDNKYRDRRTDLTDNQFSPGSSNSGENRKEAGRRKRRFSTDSDDISRDLPWHCRPPRNFGKVLRQQHRRRFEKDVEKREQEKKKIEEQMEVEMVQNVMYPVASQQYITSMADDMQPLMGQDLSMVGQAMPATATFTPSGFSGNLIQINPTQSAQPMVAPYYDTGLGQQPSQSAQPVVDPYYNTGLGQQATQSAQLMVDPYYDTGLGQQATQSAQPMMDPYYNNGLGQQPTQSAQLMIDPYFNNGLGQQVDVMPQGVQQQQDQYQHMQVPIQQNYNLTGVYGQDPNLHPGNFCFNDPNLVGQQHINHGGQQIFTTNTVNMVQPQLQQQQQQQQSNLIQPQQQPANNVTILGSQNGQAIVLLSAEQLQKLTQGDMSESKQPVQSENSSAKKLDKSDTSGNNASKTKDLQELPPNWKTATDTEGKVYYYHVITRQTQWDPPTWDGKEEDMVGKKEAEMDLSSTPTHDERRLKSSKNKNDGVTDEGRKSKETFRLRMSQFLVTCLSSYRKPDKKVGRIVSSEDFKHLARKLTHNIMEKELKQVRILEDLDFNANVKYKTKEYVKKYMSKVGRIYKIKDDTF